MGLLIDGVWRADGEDKRVSKDGRFVRPQTHFRSFVTRDGGPGPSGEGGFPAEAGRYHLYVSLACPWAHRTMIMRRLKRLDSVISMSIVAPHMGPDGWTFDADGSTGDPVNGATRLSEIYLKADARYTGRVSVPVLWDKSRHTIVNNESSEIIRMLNAAFDEFTSDRTDYYPFPLRAEIDRINTSFSRASTMVSIDPASPAPRQPMRKRSAPFSRHSTQLSNAYPNIATSLATR